MDHVDADADKQRCPFCDAVNVKQATRTSALIYLRCQECGIVWSMPDRRKTPSGREKPDRIQSGEGSHRA